MVVEGRNLRPHIYVGSIGTTEPFTSPAAGGGRRVEIPIRDRRQHGRSLHDQLENLIETQSVVADAAAQFETESPIGVQVAFESFPGVELAVESLADARQQIELVNVKTIEDQIYATVFFPEGKLTAFERKLVDYMDERKDKNGKPRDNRKLIDAVRSFRSAALDSLWTDEPELLPADQSEQFWWEVWLPVRGDRQSVLNDFRKFAGSVEIDVPFGALEFPERTIVLARGSRGQFEQSGLLLNMIAELRRAKETAAFFDGLPPGEQLEWSAELLARLNQGNNEDVHICLLDTGVNSGHPLLQPFVTDDDLYVVDPDWDAADTHGHGTGMCGLAIWGDLVVPLSSADEVAIGHGLESVKLLRHAGDNEGKHYGVLTASGIALPEIANPTRKRIFAMALTAKDGRDRGRPSSWSSEVDALASDFLGDGENPRLLVISAGNTGDDLGALMDYPDHNELQDVHDPGQSWNALTVGASTNKVDIAEVNTGYQALAPLGGLSPYSTTSVTWTSAMPIKPDVVFEGGNVGIDDISCAGLPSLKLLTCHHSPVERQFTTFEATSAATALAAKFAAQIRGMYPNLWPETVRALMIHSAKWSDGMINQFHHGRTTRQQAQHRVRCVGFGVPDLETALWSLGNSLALVIEDALQPYVKSQGGTAKTRDMHLHEIPWPKEGLEALAETEVEMTVTLSYFVEPNPSSRNIASKYYYPSHQLRFDVKRPSESLDQFRSRINRQARDIEHGSNRAPTDSDWLLGPQFRHKGSVHKDIWKGTAADLAERGFIAVYPAMGWWRTRTKLQRYDKMARYALIVSIAAPEVDVDLYTEIAVQVEGKAEVVVHT